MKISPASVTDIDSIIALVRQYWAFESLDHFNATRVRKALTKLLTTPEMGAAWLAKDNEQAVAYLILVYVFSLEHDGLTAEVDEFFVIDRCRGAGLGLSMLRTAQRAAALEGCRNLSLQVAHDNEKARRFYLSAGFSARAGYQLLEMELRLSGEEPARLAG